MAKFAPVVPLSIAKHLQGGRVGDALGNYHLLLAHDVLAHPMEYNNIYGRYQGSGGTIIMDNSLIELGHPLDAHSMFRAACILKPDWVVLPDYLGDAKRTVETSWEAAHQLCALLPKQELLGVVQGQTFDECLSCADELLRIGGVTALSVPRHLVEVLGSRIPLVQELFNRHIDVPLHLLGFSDDLLDDCRAARFGNVMGIDSAQPVRLARKGHVWSLDRPRDAGPRGTFWDDPFDPMSDDDHMDQLLTMDLNLRKVRKIIHVPKDGPL